MHPVGGRPFAVEQAGCGENKGAGADGCRARGLLREVERRRRQLLRDVSGRECLTSRDENGAECACGRGRVINGNTQSHRGAYVSARRRDHTDLVVGPQLVRLRKHVRGPRDVKEFHIVEHKDPDTVRRWRHGTTLRWIKVSKTQVVFVVSAATVSPCVTVSSGCGAGCFGQVWNPHQRRQRRQR